MLYSLLLHKYTVQLCIFHGQQQNQALKGYPVLQFLRFMLYFTLKA